MSIWFYISLLLLLGATIRFLVALLNYFRPPVLVRACPEQSPLVSILVCVSQPQEYLTPLLNALAQQQYQKIEVLVSVQRTMGMDSDLISIARNDSRFSLIEPEGVPSGWLPCNHALHLLASKAKGDYLLFLDERVDISHSLVGSALNRLMSEGLEQLSIYPRQRMVGYLERLAIPSINWLLFSTLPLRFGGRRRAGAPWGGAIMLFAARSYHEHLWHQRFCRSANAPDDIAWALGQQGQTTEALLCPNEILGGSGNPLFLLSVFLKNLFGGRTLALAIFLLVGTLAPFLVLFNLPFPLAFCFFFFALLSRMLISDLVGQSVVYNTVLWPVQHLVLLVVFFRILWNSLRRRSSSFPPSQGIA